MYQTRRQLKERIAELEKALQKEISFNKIKEESGLAEFKGQLCKGCSHAVFFEDLFGCKRFIGCDITSTCENFKNNSKEKQSN